MMYKISLHVHYSLLIHRIQSVDLPFVNMIIILKPRTIWLKNRIHKRISNHPMSNVAFLL